VLNKKKMNWNLRTFKLYNNDLWGTLLMAPTLTRPLKQLLRVRRKTRYFYKSIYGGMGKKLLRKRAKFKFFNDFYKRLSFRKGYYLIRKPYISLDKVSKITRDAKYAYLASLKRRLKFMKKRKTKVSSFLWKRLFHLFRNRYQFGYRKRKVFKPKKAGSKFIIDYTKRRSYDKFKVRIKRRTFNSQRLINFRKFKKFYSNMTTVQFYRLAAKSRNQLDSVQNLDKFISNLERRLDVVLFRAGLVTSIFMARQFISYNHICVNNYKTKKLGYPLNTYDLVSFSSKKFRSLFTLLKSVYLNRLRGYVLSGTPKRIKNKVALVAFFKPSYLEVDYKGLSSILIASSIS
jgi:ribosomal protein S4